MQFKLHLYTCILLSILATHLLSCYKTKVINTPDRNLPMNTDVGIQMQEILDSPFSTRRLQFFCFTNRLYDCSNDRINFTLSHSGKSIDLVFTSIFEPGDCFLNGQPTSHGFATALVDIGPLDTGIYVINITNVSPNACSLYVDSEKYFLVYGSKAGLENTFDSLYRAPRNVI